MEIRGCAMALGMFDGLHRGHLAVLEACRRLAHSLGCESAVYTFIENPKTLFGGIALELQSFEEKRQGMLRFGIDHVIGEHFTRELAQTPAKEFLERFCEVYAPRALVAGEDYSFGAGARGGAKELTEFCAARGIACVIVPLVMEGGEKISSTRLREAKAQSMQDNNQPRQNVICGT